MRNLFSWRLPPSEADFLSLWKNATFVFDTNFLLDLYRVSGSTAENFLKILEHIQNRIWLPYQVADEFFKRREEIMDAEAASFQKALSGLEKWQSEQHSFKSLRDCLRQSGRIVAAEVEVLFDEQAKEFLVDEQTQYVDGVDKMEKAVRERVVKLASDHSSSSSNADNILEKLLLLFDLKIGESFDEKVLQDLYKEADNRYKQLKPPGFKDSEKEGDRKYGDFILWKEILGFAKKEACPIIFVTGDKKEDWWIKKNGETISPHIELRREFKEDVQQLFWMYQPSRFLEMARDRLMIEIDPKSIEETHAISDAEFIDEQDRKTIRQALEQNQLSALQALEQLQISVPRELNELGRLYSPEFLQAIERRRVPDYDLINNLGISMPALSKFDELLRKMSSFDQISKLGIANSNFSGLDKLIEKNMLGISVPTLSKFDELLRKMSSFDQISKLGIANSNPQLELPQALSKRNVEKSKKKELVSEIIETEKTEGENLQKLSDKAGSSQKRNSLVPGKAQDKSKETESTSKAKKPSSLKKPNEENSEKK